MEKATEPHSSTLAWKIPWTEEPGGLQSMGSLRVGHDWAISLSRIGEENGNPLQCSCLENPRDGGAWWAAVYGVAQSRTWLKQLSSNSSSSRVWLSSIPWLYCWSYTDLCSQQFVSDCFSTPFPTPYVIKLNRLWEMKNGISGQLLIILWVRLSSYIAIYLDFSYCRLPGHSFSLIFHWIEV